MLKTVLNKRWMGFAVVNADGRPSGLVGWVRADEMSLVIILGQGRSHPALARSFRPDLKDGEGQQLWSLLQHAVPQAGLASVGGAVHLIESLEKRAGLAGGVAVIPLEH
jgi:hypothetical protein